MDSRRVHDTGFMLEYRGNFRMGSTIFQHLLEIMGGRQPRCVSLSRGKSREGKCREDLEACFHYLEQHGPRTHLQNRTVRWVETEANDA